MARVTMAPVRCLPILAMALLLAGAPTGASAQSALDTAQAESFLGNWTVDFQTDMGPFQFALALRDADGKVAGRMESELGSLDITDISRSGERLVMAYTMDAQGQSVPVSLSFQPNGETMQATMDVAGGMFLATGTATRAGS